MKRMFFVLLVAFLSTLGVSAQGMSIAALPSLELPIGASADLYSGGGGADLIVTYGKSEASGLRLSGGFGYKTMQSLAETPLSLASLSAGVGYQLGLGAVAVAFADLRGGGYFGSYDNERALDLGAAFDLGLRFPLGSGFSLGIGAAGSIFFAKPEPLYTGIGIQLVASFSPGASRSSRSLFQIGEPRFEPIFPVFFKWYDSNPVGRVMLLNKEPRSIRNVKASIFIKEFMESPRVFAEVESMAPGESREVAITALLNDGVLGVTESTKVSAEITVSYDLADGGRTTMRVETIRVLDRNAMTWDDDRRAASFVTARDPAILGLSKSVASGVRERAVEGGDLNLQIAIGLYQALGLYGMRYVIDPSSSYIELSKSGNSIDYLQFPRQTLSYKAGDCDDLSILYASMLESIGIESAFITVPGHILTAFVVDGKPEEIERMTARPERYVVHGGKVFVPVEATMFAKGFNAAWAEGARQWRLAGTDARLVPIREAWASYEAVGLREAPPAFSFPQSSKILASYVAEFDRFVSDEFSPQLAKLTEAVRASGGKSKDVNRLGILYARFGKYSDAESEFQKILKREEYLPALINMANLSLLRDNPKTAVSFIDRALKKDPRNRVALSTAVRIKTELGDQASATRHFAVLQSVDPTAATALASTMESPSGRASDALSKTRVEWDD